MLVREEMSDLVATVRELIQDSPPAGTAPTWSDLELQNTLDRYETTVNLSQMRETPFVLPGGVVEYHDFFSDLSWWASDVRIQDTGWNVLTADLAEPLKGHWYFTTPILHFPLVVSGNQYNVYAAAADLLTQWEAKLKCEFDFTVNGNNFQRLGRLNTIRSLRQQYRQRQGPVTIRAYV